MTSTPKISYLAVLQPQRVKSPRGDLYEVVFTLIVLLFDWIVFIYWIQGCWVAIWDCSSAPASSPSWRCWSSWWRCAARKDAPKNRPEPNESMNQSINNGWRSFKEFLYWRFDRKWLRSVRVWFGLLRFLPFGCDISFFFVLFCFALFYFSRGNK